MMTRKIALAWMLAGSVLFAQKISNIKFEGLGLKLIYPNFVELIKL
jgi:hypothetical protein